MKRPSLTVSLKHFAQVVAQKFGYEVRRRDSLLRPAGDMSFLLSGLKQKGFNPAWILDVGANWGNWSRTAKTVFPEASCFLIEPQIEMQAGLDQFCQAFPGSQWLLAGAGSKPGEMTLTVWEDLAGSSFLPAIDIQATGMKRTVQIVTIDQLLDATKFPIPQLVKLDVQGFELEALKGATQLFGQTEVLILEVSLFEFLPGQPIFDQVITFMRDRGYVVYDFPGFSRRPLDGALGQCDICFIKINSPLRKDNRWSS